MKCCNIYVLFYPLFKCFPDQTSEQGHEVSIVPEFTLTSKNLKILKVNTNS